MSSYLLTIIGIFISFSLVILFIRRKYDFGLSLIVGALILALFSIPIVSLSKIFYGIIDAIGYSIDTNSFSTGTIELAFLVTLIFMLAKSMQDTGAIRELTKSLRTFFSKGGTLAIIPAIYGLLPIPGGALLSAPMIDEEGEIFSLSKNKKNFLNIWFRHIWFPVYPLSIAMFTLCSPKFSNIPITSLMLADIPAFIIYGIIGFIILHIFLQNHTNNLEEKSKYLKGLKFLIIPFLPVILFFFLQNSLSKERAFLLSISIDIIILFLLINMSWRKYIEILYKSLTWKPAAAIIGIMVFREMFTLSGANAVISDLLGKSSLHPIILVVLVPLILGFLTGYNLAGVTLSYFFVQPFFSILNISIVGLTSLIFMGAFIGYLISPLHLCNVLSSEYLKTDVTGMYRFFIPSTFILLIAHILLVILLFS